jgi:uncharacterized protein YukE
MGEFTHDLIMDIDAAQSTLAEMVDHQKVLESAITEMISVVEDEFLLSWQGPSAMEFFFNYNQLSLKLKSNNAQLKELHTNFKEEILAWLDMSVTLAS